MSSLRFRIILSILTIIFLIVSGSYFVIQDIQTGIIEGEFRNIGLLLANNLASEISNNILIDDLVEVMKSVDNTRNNYPEIEYIYVTDLQGYVIVHSFDRGFPKALMNFTKPEKAGQEEIFETEKGVIHEFNALLFKNIGYVHIGLSENRVRTQILDASRKLLYITIYALFLGGIFAYFIGKRLTEPVLRLTDGAQRINKGILDQKIEVGSRDELSELANTFNDMASSLDQKIRELVSSKEKTQEAEKYLETLFDSIEDGIIVVNSNHEIIKMNRSFLKKTEREEKDVLGRTCHEIIFGVLPSEDQKEKCPLNSLLESKKSIRFVHEIDSGTEKKILEINASLFLDKKGVQNIIMVIRDVTQHKFIEEQIILRNRELAALKDFNDDILNNINMAIYVVDTDLKILAVNNELIKLTRGGIRKEKIINNNLFNVYPFLKDTNVELEYKHVIKTGEIFLSEEKTQYYGETIYTSTSKIPIKDKNGNIEKIITVIEDISERKKLEEELKDSYGELQLTYSKLQELYKIKDNFLSNISHELRTPLTSVIGYTELMLDEKLTQHQRHMAEIIFRNSKRLSRLIKSLLDSQLIESRNLHLAGEKVVISEIMAEVVEDMKNIAASKNIPIKINMTDTFVVEGDIERLTQVFSNLLDNAIKFTITGEINIRGEMDNQKAHIQISDTGIGIPKDRMEKIFDRFYQVDSSDERNYGGTGLGLWISKNIIEAHGGRIWAESKNSGSTFHILLPKSVRS